MHAVVLASGFNVRMREVTDNGSKAFLKIHGEYLIDKVINAIPDGIPVTVTTNSLFREDFVKWAEKKANYRWLRLFIETHDKIEDSPGTIGSLENLLHFKEGIFLRKEAMLVMAVDNFVDQKDGLAPFIDSFDGEHTLIAVHEEVDKSNLHLHGIAKLSRENTYKTEFKDPEWQQSPSGVGKMQVTSMMNTQRVVEFHEKPMNDPWPDEPLPRWAGIMCYIFPPSILPLISNEPIMHRRPAPKMPRGGDFIGHLVDSGYEVHAHRFYTHGPVCWKRVTTPEDYRAIAKEKK